MVRIAHISDTHIRNLRYHKEYREIFKTLFERLRQEKVDYIIHCGDIAHSKTQISPEFVKLCSEFLIGLSGVAPTYIILGNHDGNLKNSSREDAISPIVDALKLPNLYLLKNSGETQLNAEITLNVLSVFDRSNWVNPTNTSRINVALYHGSISNCQTDLGWTMENGENDISIFEGFDFAFLGDIHKTNQSLDNEGRIRYCGSTVQQNFGETNDKGFLIWDIKNKNDFKVKHVGIPNPKPFVTIRLTKTGRLPKNAQCPLGARLRLVSENNLPLHTMKRAISAAQHRFKVERVTYLNRAAGERGDVSAHTNNLAIDNLRDESVQKKLIKEYLKDYQPTEEQLEKVYALNKKYNQIINENEEVNRNVNWKLSTITWDNLFNYGEQNSIDFANLSGIVGIFGKNYSGKSSIIDSLLYILFNSTSKNERKNLNIINQNRENALGKAIVTIGDKEYTVERKSEKYIKKLKGEETLEAKTTVDFYVTDLVTENVQILNGTTRNETDKIIRKHFGTLEDFLLTSMSSQLGALQFISEGSTKRKEILAKFLDLEIFDKKFKLAKEDATDLRGALKRIEEKNYDDEVYEIEKQRLHLENETTVQNKKCEELGEVISTLNSEANTLQGKIDQSPAEIINIKNVTKQIKTKRDTLETYSICIAECDQKLTQNKQILDKISIVEDSFRLDEYKKKKEQIDQILDEITSLDKDLESSQKLLDINYKKVLLLDEVPCSDKYPTCKFIKDAHEANEKYFNLTQRVKDLQKQNDEKQEQVKELNEKETNSYLEKYNQVMQKKNIAEKTALELEVERKGYENNILTNQKELKELLNKKEEYEQNKELIENKEVFLRTLANITNALSTKEKEKKECQNILLEYYKEHGSLEQKIKSLEEKKQEVINLQEEYSAYDLFMRCVHTNGIAYDIIKRQLPVINDEIAKILANVVDFEVYFEADNKNLNIFIKHPKYYGRPLDLGSGAEKTLAAMAIRLALLSVSSLPKSDIFILDEPGTALDVDNMEGFISILELIKTYFKTVILISHLDGLKDCVDKQIMIDTKEGFAHISI
ncbi:MAG: putative exonuclease subunit 1 [Prokaryotic dsDNA virus sp.]|nr:MAG: putative exonuclease subunit 1 [Prokaryotic dsDNA virus sp.]|tara:strand:- start:9929 stop:13084 length:3156 start_codon:yes stop_codon:yes gene_type:complete